MAEGKGFEPLDRVNGRRFSRPVLSTTQPPLHRSDELQAYPDAETLCREARWIDGPPVDSPRAHSPRCDLHTLQYFDMKYVTGSPRQGHHQRALDTQGSRVLYLAGRRERNGSGQSGCRRFEQGSAQVLVYRQSSSLSASDLPLPASPGSPSPTRPTVESIHE